MPFLQLCYLMSIFNQLMMYYGVGYAFMAAVHRLKGFIVKLQPKTTKLYKTEKKIIE